MAQGGRPEWETGMLHQAELAGVQLDSLGLQEVREAELGLELQTHQIAAHRRLMEGQLLATQRQAEASVAAAGGMQQRVDSAAVALSLQAARMRPVEGELQHTRAQLREEHMALATLRNEEAQLARRLGHLSRRAREELALLRDSVVSEDRGSQEAAVAADALQQALCAVRAEIAAEMHASRLHRGRTAAAAADATKQAQVAASEAASAAERLRVAEAVAAVRDEERRLAQAERQRLLQEARRQVEALEAEEAEVQRRRPLLAEAEEAEAERCRVLHEEEEERERQARRAFEVRRLARLYAEGYCRPEPRRLASSLMRQQQTGLLLGT